ncbi:hypothetical protein POVWA2_003280 [Plasmodium ovale wallikeri]|uniref:Uncharacterized protein n=1 Tax=Plasmodium ovale wallikeri TaxID=864142 RepID=A0A1A8YIA1_PLAOA|nr:hypothetical protein POVWA1_003090 [Plasmodium ovale wallikeri]SBT31269.1 hypothetical protein POVWA2_003280 [Plasmodium ovale wallikeri]
MGSKSGKPAKLRQSGTNPSRIKKKKKKKKSPAPTLYTAYVCGKKSLCTGFATSFYFLVSLEECLGEKIKRYPVVVGSFGEQQN